MKIKTGLIPRQGGLDLDFLLSPEELGEVNFQNDETFSKSADCKIHLDSVDDDIFLKGKTLGTLDVMCGRCAQHFEKKIDLSLFVTCSPRDRSSQSDQDSEEGLVFFDYAELDLAQIIREQFLLALPMNYLCREDCKGLCNQCGTDLNLGEHTCMKPNPS